MATYQNVGGLGATQEVSNLEQSKLFGNAIMELLKSYQGTEKYPYAERGFRGQEEQVRRAQSTDQSLIGASPGLQAGVRQASVSAVEPTVQGAQAAGQTFRSRLETFGEVLNQARGLQQQMEQAALRSRDEAKQLINNSLSTLGGDAFLNADPQELANLEKLAGLPKGYISQTAQAIKARENAIKAEQKRAIEEERQYELERERRKAPQTITGEDRKIFQWNPQTQRWEFSGLREPAKPIRAGGGGGGGGGRGLTLEDKRKDPLAGFLAIGGQRRQKPDGGFDFVGPNGQSMTVQEAAGLIPGATVGEFLKGSVNPVDQPLISGKKVAKGKPLTDTATQKFAQFNDVKAQLSQIKNYAQSVGFTDPVSGQIRIRNPYDAPAQQLNRMIIAIVPALARGVFGEVGVLTDKDVERYSKLLPNVKTPAAQMNEAYSYIFKRVDSGYNNFLNSYKNAGFDVSGFERGSEGSGVIDLSKYIK